MRRSRVVPSCDRCNVLGFVCFAHATKMRGREEKVNAAILIRAVESAQRRIREERALLAAIRAEEKKRAEERRRERERLWERRREFAESDCHHGERRSECPLCWRYCEPHNELACGICDPQSLGAPK